MLGMHNPQFDFGYPWWLNYGHLSVAAISVVILALGFRLKWSRWLLILFCVLTLWAGAVFLSMRSILDFNSPPELPTQSFLKSGSGRVLDLGAGTGRSAIMVLKARPQATLVALDLFSQSFDQHFGPGVSPQDRLMANLKVAEVDQRAAIQAADMRKLPFEAATFDAIVSSYAIDHLNRDGVKQTLAESARVLKPGGEILLMLIQNDGWAKFAFGPLLSHGATRGPDWWKSRMQEAGFRLAEEGTFPVTLWLLARRDGSV